MTARNYAIGYSVKTQWSWKFLSYIEVDSFKVVEESTYIDYCTYDRIKRNKGTMSNH